MTKLQLRLLLIGVVSTVSLAFAAVVVTFVVIFYGYASTPLTTIYLHNDLNVTVEIASCNADPQEISPNGTLTLDVISITRMRACGVYVNPPTLEGCLYLPADTYPAGSNVNVSQMVRGVSASECVEANK